MHGGGSGGILAIGEGPRSTETGALMVCLGCGARI
ncbi:hypothetical protein Pyrfu_1704 [Pyrolobus fumarii 1A]|uniref:Uncharacterized protein n=1 Tax=Pyrolobus fumarii (strain DSM 11204 / 1A) TaxID=694429 RepID=G0ECJ0_PYRF1|nr:hypothetical protein Pyrfu_1704 [Pyrolobus fumarii 1A]